MALDAPVKNRKNQTNSINPLFTNEVVFVNPNKNLFLLNYYQHQRRNCLQN